MVGNNSRIGQSQPAGKLPVLSGGVAQRFVKSPHAPYQLGREQERLQVPPHLLAQQCWEKAAGDRFLIFVCFGKTVGVGT